jgi:hypothetical protein
MNPPSLVPFGYSVCQILHYVHNFGYRLRHIVHEDWIAEPYA